LGERLTLGDGAWRPPSKKFPLVYGTDCGSFIPLGGPEEGAAAGRAHYKTTRKNGFHLTVLLGHSKEFMMKNRGAISRGAIHHKNQHKRIA